jgi:hypothetical protein
LPTNSLKFAKFLSNTDLEFLLGKDNLAHAKNDIDANANENDNSENNNNYNSQENSFLSNKEDADLFNGNE